MVLLTHEEEKIRFLGHTKPSLSLASVRRTSTHFSCQKRRSLKSGTIFEEKPDFYFKLVLLGDSCTGKTTLMTRFNHDFCSSCTSQRRMGATVGLNNVEFSDKILQVSGKQVLARLYDTAGQEKYRSLTASYYRGAHGCLILYDVTKESSFDNLNYWLHDLKEYTTQPEISTILVGTKCHVSEEKREVTYDRAQKFAESIGIPYMEVSAEEGINVTEVFEALADQIIEKLKREPVHINVTTSVKLTSEKKKQKKEWCSC